MRHPVKRVSDLSSVYNFRHTARLRETFFVSVLVERGLVIEFSLHAPSPETMNLLNSPLAVFSLSLLTLWLAAQIGGLIRRRFIPVPESEEMI